MKPLSDCRLYGILDTGYVAAERMSEMAAALIRGGVDILQLRAKRESPGEILAMARAIAPSCRMAGVPLILNDYPELVQQAGADGAHVGQEDMSVTEARRLAGRGAIVGKSTHSPEQALATASEFPDYIGFGPLFATPTKPDYVPIGLSGIPEVHRRLSLPVFCIGGIRSTNLAEVIAAGAWRVVIVSDLLLAPDPGAQAASCKALLGE